MAQSTGVTDLVFTIVFTLCVIVVTLGWMAFKLPELKQTRFSLRSLLIATTLVAIVLGLAVALR